MEPELEEEFVSNDPVLQEAAWKGELTPVQVAMIQEQLVSAGMTAEEAVDDPEELKTRLLQKERRKEQAKKDAGRWDNFANNMEPGVISAIVSGVVESWNGFQKLFHELSARKDSIPLALIALPSLKAHFEQAGGEWNIGQSAKIVRSAGESFETAADTYLENTPRPEDVTSPDVPEGVGHQFVKGAAQFITGQVVIQALFAGARPAAWYLRAAREAREGAVVGGVFFKGDDPNLADNLAAFFDLDRDPETGISPVSEALRAYLGTQEDDDMLTQRLKNAVANMPLDLALPAVMAAFKGIKDKLVWGAEKLGEKIVEPASGQIGLVKPQPQAPPDLVSVTDRMRKEGFSEDEIQEALAQVATRKAAEVASAADERLIVDQDVFDDFIALQAAPPQQHFSKAGAELPGQSAAQTLEEVRRGGQSYGINWKYKTFDSPEDVMQIVDELSVAIKETLDRRLGDDPATWDGARIMAEQLNLNPETLQGIAGTLKLTRYQMIGYHIIQAQGQQRLLTLRNAVNDAVSLDEKAVAEVRFFEHFNTLATMHYWIAGAEQEMGRLLNAQKAKFDGSESSTFFNAYIDSKGGGGTFEQLSQLVDQIQVQRETGAPGVWLEQLKVASRTISRGVVLTRDLVVDIAVQGMIGNLVTFFRNVGGTGYATLERLLVKQIAGFVPGSGVHLGEALVGLKAAFRHFPDAVMRSTVALITDKPNTSSYRKDYYKSAKQGPLAQAFEGKLVNSELFISDGISLLNKMNYAPGRVNLSLDEFFSSINIGMEREALAFRLAKKLESQGALSPEYTVNDVFNDVITRNSDAPSMVTSQFERITKQEMKIAAQMTFAVRAGSTPSYFNGIHDFVQRIQKWDPSGISRLLFPFYNTTANLDKFALERIPGANFLIREASDDFFGLNGRELQAEAFGKLFIGVGILATGFELAESGGMTAGFPPQPDPRKSTTEDTSRIPSRQFLIDSDWQPYSILREDGYASLAGLDPVTMLLQGGADVNMLFHIYSSPEVQRGLFASDADLKSAVDATSEFFFEYLVEATRTKIETRPASKGLSDVWAISDPDDFRHQAAVSNVLTNLNPLASFYQTLRSQFARADDRYQRNAKAREAIAKSHKNFMRRNTAFTDLTGEGGSKALNPRVNFMGDPFLHQVPFLLEGVDFSRVQAFFNIVRITPKDLNPVSVRIAQLGGLSSDYPVRWTQVLLDDASGKKKPFDLTDEQQYEWVKEATKLNRQVLPKLVKSFKKEFSANTQREMLENAIAFNKEKAQVDVLRRPGSSWAPIAKQLAGLKAAAKRGKMGDLRPPEFYNTTGNPREPLQQFIESP